MKPIDAIKKIDLEPALIGVSITVILSVELVVNVVSMSILAPGNVEKIGFIAMAVVIVCLGLPAYLIGKKRLWLCFVILAVFLNTSFILESLRVQSTPVTISNDREIKRIDGLISDCLNVESELQKEYAKALADANMVRIDAMIKAKQVERSGYKSDRLKRVMLVSSGSIHEPITGNAVFIAIPTAIGLKNIPASPIQLSFFLLLFISSQWALTVFSSRGKEMHKPDQKKEKPMRIDILPQRIRNQDHVTKFVRTTWHNVRNNRSQKIVNQQSFMRMNPDYDSDVYNKLINHSIKLGHILNGKIVEKDEQKVIKELTDISR